MGTLGPLATGHADHVLITAVYGVKEKLLVTGCVVYFQFPAILFGSVLGRLKTYSIFNKTVSFLFAC